MIPRDVEADELLIEVPVSGWTLQYMSTNWPGYWILQLAHHDQPPLALLTDFSHLTAICQAMRSCIDAARNPGHFPRAETMLVTAASELSTPTNDEGAVSVMTEWSSDPVMVISYYRGGRGDGNVIRQALAIDDAMALYNLFATVYNRFPEKRSWKPRMQE